jgi:hypothetical protein
MNDLVVILFAAPVIIAIWVWVAAMIFFVVRGVLRGDL